MPSDLPESRAAFAVHKDREGSQNMLSVGKQCSEASCHLVDFLPTKCDHCHEAFCQDHYRPDTHNCKKWDRNAADRRAIECMLYHRHVDFWSSEMADFMLLYYRSPLLNTNCHPTGRRSKYTDKCACRHRVLRHDWQI